ncbi:hypothetical protein GLOTRDRAFT_135187 [Gloeophyllum trabeum ATCC 11539]|uniref:Uncharacterized protein n=1 Tax=Gloeophyllum trabeum (strain ATCC 11539 / FP-39264 / Madison 617) TaxID=670483 RepID=S7RZR5_GLOTA|nr:uncharacterized protein GLOTRDRAFT_135187 [Gloeophyllum trabeum ATCC 11539]EPQ60515.1 hypothetical protein GLOTRDRAFT_135187 [Gloeophyllum trabeum ATCC 11539]
MSLAPSPSVSRGTIILQPSFFTSSLYVNPLREDILHLIRLFIEQYLQTRPTQPFALFKEIWNSQGWTWLHFKVFDVRTRDTFLQVTARLFLEHMSEAQPVLNRVTALFCLYTFYFTQPTTSTPSLHPIEHIPIASDVYETLTALPASLSEPHLATLGPHVTYVLSTLLDAKVFHILPSSNLNPHNPCTLPREIFIHDDIPAASYEHVSRAASAETGGRSGPSTPVPEAPLPKKKGRPSKRERMRKSKDALLALDRWLDKSAWPPPGQQSQDPEATQQPTTHVLITGQPTASLNNYRSYKYYLMDTLVPRVDNPHGMPNYDSTRGQMAIQRANTAILARLKKIDQMAAEEGLEVGGEGGDRTGLTRVEKAVQELGRPGAVGSVGGILALLEGAGLDEKDTAEGSGAAAATATATDGNDVPMSDVQTVADASPATAVGHAA